MLYHFSEEKDISIFKPRTSKTSVKPVVWAIDGEHALHYYFPRNCPRVIYWKTEHTNEQDLARFFPESSVDKIMVVASGWLEQIREMKLYKYTFEEASFELFDANAGYYVSSEDIIPVRVEPVGDLLGKLIDENIELRFTPNLLPIRNRVASSSLGFSIIRFNYEKTK